uniref:GDP-mannose pyrophosphorylase Ab n=1 Tax=Eptatretus burgeri TaxID=7764 RepID=A0A8C4PX38_EPTBU
MFSECRNRFTFDCKEGRATSSRVYVRTFHRLCVCVCLGRFLVFCTMAMDMVKSVILIGGSQKGTRFRPLSLDLPKPLFPVAGFPIIQHHIEACSKVPEMKEILLIGFFQPSDVLNQFVSNAQQQFRISVRYLQEYSGLGTGGGLYHFRDQIMAGNPKWFFVLNGDVCADFPLVEMLKAAENRPPDTFSILCTNANRKQSLNYGCIVANAHSKEVLHYVEKPSTFVSELINCGVYLFTPKIFEDIATVFHNNQQELLSSSDDQNGTGNGGWQRAEVIHLERDVFAALAGHGRLYAHETNGFWSQIKSAGSAIYASRLYLNSYHDTHPERLATNGENKPRIVGNVYIHLTATVDPTALLGPNVTVGPNVIVGPGVRIKESIILQGSYLQDNCCILNAIVGWNSTVGRWARVEGTPSDPNPNDPFAKINSETLFNPDGRLNPSITILGVMFADFHTQGRQPKEDRLNREYRGGQRMAEQDLRTWTLMPSGSIAKVGSGWTELSLPSR